MLGSCHAALKVEKDRVVSSVLRVQGSRISSRGPNRKAMGDGKRDLVKKIWITRFIMTGSIEA